MHSDYNPSPVNPLPPVVLGLFILIIAVEGLFSLGANGFIGGPEAIGWRQGAIQDYGFNSTAFLWMLENQTFPSEYLLRFLTYPFLNWSFTQALFGGVMVLALGKFVGEVFPQWAVVVIFFVSSCCGAIAFGFVAGEQPYLIGAFPGVYGLIGAFTFLMWLKLGQMGAPQARAFTMIGFLMGIQLLFGILFGGNRTWLADLAGFACGFGLSFFITPGGWQKFRARIRHQ